MDYTVLGDIVNLAARLESLTREIGKGIALTEAVRDACGESWSFVHTGNFNLKGQNASQPIYSVNDPAVVDMKNFQEISTIVSELCCELT
jgi:adenylate cyclase